MIGAAHLGLFLLLTASARKDVEALEQRYGASRLTAVEDPGSRPSDAAEVPRWLRAQSLWEAARKRSDREDYIALFGYALAGSFLLQAVVTGALLYRSTHRPGRSGRARSRA